MSEKVPAPLEGMGFDGPTVGREIDSSDTLRRMIEKVQAEPDGALTCYDCNGNPVAVMIHPFVWDVLVMKGIVVPTDQETAWRQE